MLHSQSHTHRSMHTLTCFSIHPSDQITLDTICQFSLHTQTLRKSDTLNTHILIVFGAFFVIFLYAVLKCSLFKTHIGMYACTHITVSHHLFLYTLHHPCCTHTDGHLLTHTHFIIHQILLIFIRSPCSNSHAHPLYTLLFVLSLSLSDFFVLTIF